MCLQGKDRWGLPALSLIAVVAQEVRQPLPTAASSLPLRPLPVLALGTARPLPAYSFPTADALLSSLCSKDPHMKGQAWGGRSDEDPFPHEAGQTFQVDRQELK